MNQIKQSLVKKSGIEYFSKLIILPFLKESVFKKKPIISSNILKINNQIQIQINSILGDKYFNSKLSIKSFHYLSRNFFSSKFDFQNEEFKRIKERDSENNNIQFRSDYDLSITSFGFGGLGSNNIIFRSNHQALIPIGPNIGVWDLKEAKRLRLIQTNKDTIFQILETSYFIITISISGQVSILEKIELKQIYQYQAQGRSITNLIANDKFVIIASKSAQNTNDYTIEVYSLKEFTEKKYDQTPQPQIIKIKGKLINITLAQNDSLITLTQVEYSPQGYFRDDSCADYYHLSTYSLLGEFLTVILQFSLTSKIQSFQSNSQFGVILTQNRNLMIIDLLSKLVLSTCLIKGSSQPIKNLKFINNNLQLSPADNYILNINCDSLQENNLNTDIQGDQETVDKTFSVKKLQSKGVSPSRNLIKINNDFIFSSNEDGFIYEDLHDPHFQKQYSGLSISATCISVSFDGDYVAVGDMTGNVFIYSSQNSISNEPMTKIILMSGIRSLDWDPRGDTIVIGTFDGRIIRKHVLRNQQQQQTQPELLAQLEGSITTLKFKNHNQQLLLLATNTKGLLAILKENNTTLQWEVQSIIQAHSPQNSSENFGTLNQFAEIWGSSWSCNGTSTIATSSEDQRIHIFDNSQSLPQLINQLDGHKLAVTAIDWKKMNNSLGDIFISCSDDQTIRVYDPNNNFQLLHIYSTSFVKEWHTLTYISLEEGGNRVAVGAQNGYLFIIDLSLKKFVFAERIHMGGIEGIVWKGRRIYTCSNDCTWNIVNI